MKTVSLELSKQLKEAGYPEDYLGFYWQLYKKSKPMLVKGYGEYFNGEQISSPTADEILDELPSRVEYNDRVYFFSLSKDQDFDEYMVAYVTQDHLPGHTLNFEIDKYLAECVGKMYIYLKKEGLL